MVLSSLDMSFVNLDRKEAISEPPPSDIDPENIDAWARSSIPKGSYEKREEVKKSFKAIASLTAFLKVKADAPQIKEVFDAERILNPPVVSEEGRRQKVDDRTESDDEEVRYRDAKVLEEKKKDEDIVRRFSCLGGT